MDTSPPANHGYGWPVAPPPSGCHPPACRAPQGPSDRSLRPAARHHAPPPAPPTYPNLATQRRPPSTLLPLPLPPPLVPGVGGGSIPGVRPALSPSSPLQQQPQSAWALQPCTGPDKLVSHPCRGQSPDGTSTQTSRGSPGDGGVSSSPSSESRYGLDPQLLPSAVREMEEDRAEWGGKVFVSEPNAALPPLATTDCVTEDRGSARPGYMRSTSYRVPCEGQGALLSHLPLGILASPLARAGPGERPLPVVGEAECVPGCEGCGARMCPAMTWQDCGQRFYCPFCAKLSEVCWQYYQPTRGVGGVRLDQGTRPELSLGSYEVLHSQQGQAAVLVLVLDVSPVALSSGQLDLITQQLRHLLTALTREDGDVRVGLMTYDSRIHLYDLSPALSRPHMLVVTETEDLQLPVWEGLLVPLRDCIDSIDSVLQQVPLYTPETDHSTGVTLELPVRAGLAILQAVDCPGKLLIFHTAPLIERTHTHTSSGFFSNNKPKSLFQPPDADVSLAKECVRQGCGVHLFVFSQQDVGGAWPGHVPYLTGGGLHSYDSLQGELERERFGQDLRRSVETQHGYRAQISIYVSKDMRVSGCYGSFAPGPSPSRVALATLDWRTTLAVELSHSRALEEKRGVVVQVVLSYSGPAGERRTRVHTLTLRCSPHLLDTFRHCQAQTLLAFYCKKMYCSVLERPLQELREELQTEVTEALACYRKHCSSSVSPGQLVLPQPLRSLPVYTNSLRKSEVLLPGLRCSVHTRLLLRCALLAMDTAATARHFYPLMIPLPLSPDASGGVTLASAVRCTAASLEPRGVYLALSPLALLLWVGRRAPPHALELLLNTACLSATPSGETKLPVLDNPLSRSVRALVQTLTSQEPSAVKLVLVKQGDGCEEALQRLLVEDKSPNGGASYPDFLYHLHVNSLRLLV